MKPVDERKKKTVRDTAQTKGLWPGQWRNYVKHFQREGHHLLDIGTRGQLYELSH